MQMRQHHNGRSHVLHSTEVPASFKWTSVARMLYASMLNLRNHSRGMYVGPDTERQKVVPIPQLLTGSI